ncbi:MAG: VWA domain-containing protein, partial [Spirochaetaceae bacterium]|nr:VWA domain-containing protein [Spirochaetaceae bacterium]
MGSRLFKEGQRISGKKLLLLVLFFCLPLLFISGQENPIDLVLILDTSSSMSGSYQNTIDYVTGGFLKEFLRIGDTFHLISFSDTPRLEIVRRIEGPGDIETLIGRLFLMYPLDPRSDISRALAYGEQYVASIPGTRQKKVVFVSDGDHSPPPEGTAGDPLQNRIAGTTARLSQAGVDFYYVPVPILGTGPSSGRSRMQPAVPPAPATQAQQTAPPVPATTPRPQQPAAPAQQA